MPFHHEILLDAAADHRDGEILQATRDVDERAIFSAAVEVQAPGLDTLLVWKNPYDTLRREHVKKTVTIVTRLMSTQCTKPGFPI